MSDTPTKLESLYDQSATMTDHAVSVAALKLCNDLTEEVAELKACLGEAKEWMDCEDPDYYDEFDALTARIDKALTANDLNQGRVEKGK